MLFGSGTSSRISRLVIPPIRNAGQLGRVQPVHRGAQRAGGQRPVPARVEHPVQDVLAGPAGSPGSGPAGRCSSARRRRGSRSASANASCSACARLTQSMSSNSSSAALSGVRRLSSRPGRCRMTWRRRPTSESTWNMALPFLAGPGPEQPYRWPAYAAAWTLDLGLASRPADGGSSWTSTRSAAMSRPWPTRSRRPWRRCRTCLSTVTATRWSPAPAWAGPSG